MDGTISNGLNALRNCCCSMLMATATLAFSSPAKADFKVCNDTKNLVGVSVGYRLKDGWNTEGWWRIPAGGCAAVIEGNLASRFFYLHAEDSTTGGQWRGPVYMCTSSKEFRIKDLKDCYARGYERTGFFEVDTGDQESWQVRLTETNQSDATDEKESKTK